MYLIKQTELFSKWLYKLKDIEKAKELLKEFDNE